MSIKDLAGKFVATVHEDASLADASNLMQEYHVGCLVVVREYDGKKVPSGMITDRDLALTIGGSPRAEALSVKHVMRGQPVVAFETDGVFETMTAMRRYGVRRIPVINERGELTGIICADDLLELIAEELVNLAKITETQIFNEESLRLPDASHLRS